MGRWYYRRKATTEESCDLTISALKKRGLLSGQVTGTAAWTSSMTGKTTTVLLAADIADDPHVRFMYTFV